jgi:hypothetical protein
MQHKYSVIIAAVVLGLTVTLFAVEKHAGAIVKQAGASAPTLIRLNVTGRMKTSHLWAIQNQPF